MGIIKKIITIIGVFCFSFGIISCGSDVVMEETKSDFDGRVFYEIFVRAFNDTNGDGIGDLNGVTQKLDYMEDLGVGGIWLMPVNPSPSYHGYDVTDYKEINSEYGSMEDFKLLIEEAHKRDIKVYIDMVINHTSSEHNWFKKASLNEENFKDYYIWTDDDAKAEETSPMGTKPWSKADGNEDYHYGIFWGGMPDLNLDNKEVKNELFDIAKFYIDMGVDGFRMDAVKWFYNEDDLNNKFVEEYSAYCKSLNENFKLIGEVWDQPSVMAKYQNSLDSFFDFSLGENITKRINSGGIERLPEAIKKNYEMYTRENEQFVPAPFLSNHDQTRVMNVLRQSDDKMKMAATIYMTLPGTPFIYYGEELGMTGKKPDEMIREPFIWDNQDISKNTSWIEVTNDINKVALSVQENDEGSIYNFYKNIIKARNENKSLSYGSIEMIETGNKNIMCMKREQNNEVSYVMINNSKEASSINIESGKYKVSLSNMDKVEDMKIDETVDIQAGEILILTK